MRGMTLAQFGSLALAFAVAAIIISMGAEILGQVRTTQTNNTSYQYNVTTKALTGTKTFGDWLPTIAVVVAAAIVIGVIVNYFRG